jgi:hypothetical protein
MDNIDITGNKYASYIVNPPKGFIDKLLLKRKIRKSLKKLSPSFNEMKQMAECLCIMDMIYLFENDVDINKISASIRPKLGQYTINTKPNKNQLIVITLSEPDTISINITNNGKLRHKISFTSGEYSIKDKYDEILFINIIGTLMDNFTDVLLKYIA